MAKKSLYKRAVDPWSDDVKEHTRAKENKMFEKNQSDKVGSRKKSTKKGRKRANHEHIYSCVIIWRESYYEGKMLGSVGCRCSICGKRDNQNYYLLKSYLFKDKKEEYMGELEHFELNSQGELVAIDSKTYQETIFLGGSKTINNISEKVKKEIVDFMNLGHNIVIGDCMGADFLMQKLLAENHYPFVTVYYSGERPRFNLGNWQTKQITSNYNMSAYEKQKLKDVQMAIDCNLGFMLLKGQSKGTMANIKEILKLNKKCEVCITDYNEKYPYMLMVKNEKDLERIDWYYRL